MPDTTNSPSNNPQQQQQQQEQQVSSYDAILDVCAELVQTSAVMEELDLGPNGGLMWCMEYLEQHVDELIDLLEDRMEEEELQQDNDNAGGTSRGVYLLLDLPGQAEVYTHGTSVATILQKLVKTLDLRLCVVQLLDATYCLEAHKYVSATLLATTTMLRLELPTIQVLSKTEPASE